MDDDVYVWQIGIGACAPVDTDMLDARERARAAAFKFEDDRQRFLAAHTALRTLLAHHTAVAPAALLIEADADGKPRLHHDAWQFNLSHSADLALLAVARGSAIGVDVEKIRPLARAHDDGRDESLALAERHYSPAEVRHLRDASPSRRSRDFFRCWVRKEAMVKATGTGIFTDLRLIDAGFEGAATVGAWHLQSIELDAPWTGEDYVAAIATAGPRQVRLRRYPQDLSAA